MQRRAFLAGLSSTALGACSAQAVWAPEVDIDAVAFRSGGPANLTLYTMKNVASGSGAHTALLVDASQRVLFDPAGTFGHPTIPERNDVLYGFSPQVEEYYVSYHARETFYVIGQTVVVDPAVAETALQLVQTNGAVRNAHCSQATSKILRRLPGFGSLPQTFFPNPLSAGFSSLPGVSTREFHENDPDNKSVAAAQIDMQIRAVR